MNRPAEEMLHEFAEECGAANINDAVILPGSGVTIKATAAELYKRIEPTKTMFIRGGAVVGIVENNCVRLDLKSLHQSQHDPGLSPTRSLLLIGQAVTASWY